MNTQTHVLLAAVVFSGVVAAGSSAVKETADIPDNPAARYCRRCLIMRINIAVLLGGLFPDASIVLMWAIAKVQGVPNHVVWSEWYFSQRWQSIAAMTNSMPVYISVAWAAFVAGGRFFWQAQVLQRPWVSAILAFSCAALLHTICDFPLHVDDGHPHFWPFSDWIFHSTVSYWDSAHYATIWKPIEIGIALIATTFLWLRFSSLRVRVWLVMCASSYGMTAFYWFSAF